MEDTLVLGAYASAMFSAAYMFPPEWRVIRYLIGYASLLVFISIVVGFLLPDVADCVLRTLNGGVKAVWNRM